MDATLSAPIGQLLDGRYLVESQIARGGMATVYLARDVRLERTVALKIAHPELAHDREFVDRFIGEARAVARLSSPNVVAIFDQGSTGDLNYIAMEYVPGPTLRELLASRGRLDPQQALDILESVLSGLAMAHDAGIVHRDVKPENVLLGNGTAIKVADFGLARAASGIRHTRTGLLIGTAAYLAPEQVASNSSDQRTDVYAAGVMLFEMLTGRQPHTGDTPLAVAYKHVNSIVPAPSMQNPELPPALDALVAIATSRDPDLRPADAGHYLHAVKEVRSGMPVPPVTRRDALAAAQTGYPAPDRPAPAGAQGSWPTSTASNGASPAGGNAAGTGALGPPAHDGRTTQYSHGGYPPAAADRPQGSGHHTMVIPVGQEPDFGGGYPGHRHRTARGYREPFLQQWLFSGRILIVPAVVLVAVLIWWLGFGRYSTVPSVAGQRVAAARSELTNAGFHVVTGTPQHNDTVPSGRVIRITPAAGTRTGHGAQVVIIPSLGPVMVQMPPVTDLPIQQAEQTIQAAGLTPDVVGQTTLGVPPGIVVATSPGAFQQTPKNKPVKLFVPGVPNFVGQQISDVQDAASSGGYNINQIPDPSSTQPQGTVTAQDVKPGTVIQPGTVVNVQVSQASPSGSDQSSGDVSIPDVRGQQVDQATAALQQAGFKVDVNQSLIGQTVIFESPTGQAPPGTTVTITLGLSL